MLLNSLSSLSSAGWVRVGSLLPHKPSRTPRRTNASMRCKSDVVAKLNQAGEAYINLASTTDLYISFSASTHMLWLRRTFIAYRSRFMTTLANNIAYMFADCLWSLFYRSVVGERTDRRRRWFSVIASWWTMRIMHCISCCLHVITLATTCYLEIMIVY